jgi:hypothetical protein
MNTPKIQPLQVFARWPEKRKNAAGLARMVERRAQPKAGTPLTRDYYFDGAAVRRVHPKLRGKSVRRAEKAARRAARERAAYVAQL